MQREGEAPVLRCLSRRYGLCAHSFSRIRRGLGTRNWVLRSDRGAFFVKEYPASTDFAAETAAVELSEHARRSGIPAPRVVPATDGCLIAVEAGLAIAVFEFIEPAASESRLSLPQMRAA